MACYFAKLNESNVVIQTVVVGDDIPTANGPLSDNPCHVDGETYCQNLYKHTNTWKQYFRGGSHRVRRAGLGYIYDESRDAFISSQPHPSWSLDNDTIDWVPPVAKPELPVDNPALDDGSPTYIAKWDENNVRWVGRIRLNYDNNWNWKWNPINSTWEEI